MAGTFGDGSIDVVDNVTVSAGRPRLVEVGEAGCMWMISKLAGVWWTQKRVGHRPVGDRRRMLQPISRVMSRSVGRGSLLFGRLPTRDRR